VLTFVFFIKGNPMRLVRFALAALAFPLATHFAYASDLENPIPRAIYTQQGFNSAPASREFKDWQRRFQADWDAFFERAQSKRKDDLIEKAAELFTNSIEASEKGLSFKKYLVNAVYSGSPDVADAGVIAKRMILSPHANPVGYGGVFEQEGYQVEIWYMALHDLPKMNQEDFKKAAAYSSFETLELPKLNAGTRGTWPVLLFVRGKNKRLMMYGHSKEIFTISEKAAVRQLF
jgi:hypothetical protein